jgi:hypothetical protein
MNKLHLSHKDARGAIFACDECDYLTFFDNKATVARIEKAQEKHQCKPEFIGKIIISNQRRESTSKEC